MEESTPSSKLLEQSNQSSIATQLPVCFEGDANNTLQTDQPILLSTQQIFFAAVNMLENTSLSVTRSTNAAHNIQSLWLQVLP
jgi:hypothetical protein